MKFCVNFSPFSALGKSLYTHLPLPLIPER